MGDSAASALKGLARKLFLASAALAWERLWPALWPATAIMLVFAVVAVWGGFELLPGWLHLAVLTGFAVGLLATLRRAARRLRWPTTEESRRRIERDSGAAHRPLEALTDTLGRPAGAQMLSLWQAHQARALAAARKLRVAWPRAGLAARDPRGFRIALGLLLLVGFVSTGGEWRARFTVAFTPDLRGGERLAPELAAWIAPPAYTAVPPIFLTPAPGQDPAAFVPPAAPGETIRVPAGAEFFARVHGGRGLPQLSGATPSPLDFTQVDSANFQVTAVLDSASGLRVSQGRGTLGDWTIEIVPDRAPEIAHAHPVVVTQRMALQIQYAATDDYGLAAVRLRVRRTDTGAEEVLEIPLPVLHPRESAATRVFDLTPHPWAGLPVALILEAEDGTGQTGVAAPVRIRLPEREFTNPIARAIIEQRRNLVAEPGRRDEVHEALDVIADLNAVEIGDYGTYLLLRSSVARLRYDQSDAAVAEVVDQLWTTALALEDGALGVSERALRDAQQALQDALSRDAPDAEIERLIEELRQAMQDYMQALAERARDNPPEAGQQPGEAPTLSARDLMDMLDRAMDLNRLGAREAAQQLLSELQQMMENLRAGTPQQGQGMAEETLQELNEMMQQQQQLRDQTFQQEQRGAFGDPAQLPEAGEQRSLGQRLQEMMEGVGEMMGQVPGAFGEAAEAMENAARALQQGEAGQALEQQTEALDQMRQGASQMIQQMMEQMLGQQPGDRPGGQFGEDNPEPATDPLGRPMPGLGADVGDRVKVPDIGDLQRAREILDELFRRAGERGRPLLELNYLERLLRRF